MTSNAPLLVFNRLWSLMPEIQGDILRIAERKHVILADEGIPELTSQEGAKPIHLVKLSATKHHSDSIQVNVRRLDRRKAG